jgi:transposase-like protein
VPERFLSNVVKEYGEHPVSTDGGTWYSPQACQFLKLNHHIHSSYEKSIIERTIQHIKDRTEYFDDYFPCRKKNCKLKHVQKWLNLFLHIIITRRKYLNFTELSTGIIVFLWHRYFFMNSRLRIMTLPV